MAPVVHGIFFLLLVDETLIVNQSQENAGSPIANHNNFLWLLELRFVSFIQQILIEYLLHARLCSGHGTAPTRQPHKLIEFTFQ